MRCVCKITIDTLSNWYLGAFSHNENIKVRVRIFLVGVRNHFADRGLKRCPYLGSALTHRHVNNMKQWTQGRQK